MDRIKLTRKLRESSNPFGSPESDDDDHLDSDINLNNGHATQHQNLVNPISVSNSVSNSNSNSNSNRRSGIQRAQLPVDLRLNSNDNYSNDNEQETGLPPLSMRRLLGRLYDTNHSHAQVSLLSFVLGVTLCAGFTHAFIGSTHQLLGLYLGFLSLFHYMEYLTTAMHRYDVGMNSFVLNHSRAYHIALSFGFIEYLVEWYFWPSSKQLDAWTIVGCITVLLFQSLRSLAMMTAGANFTHLISFRKEHNHVLVTDGIYSILRHPSYTAFFYWAVILQGGVMKNPVACLGYCVALCKFFVNRIRIEEDTLVHFFGPQYEEYRKQSWVFIPGVWN